ncbi:RraA family protein [Hwanghaeella sp.]|uniref:RraA family protein n=1 Tax=Hwanghaeella sp. TaxID=2605943 RepID=UPI003CCBBF5C
MIKEKPIVTIRRGFDRPDPALVDALRGAMTGHVVDSMSGRGALDYRIKPIEVSRSAICGTALTVKAAPGDNMAVNAALDVAKPGDIIVCATDSFVETAVVGDLLLGMMKNVGAGAFVTDGLIRDLIGVRGVGLPVFAMGVTPNSPTGGGTGTVGLPIMIGGVHVSPGDVIVGDEDGVVVVPQAELSQVIETLKEVRALEAEAEAKVKAGQDRSPKFTALQEAGKVLEI